MSDDITPGTPVRVKFGGFEMDAVFVRWTCDSTAVVRAPGFGNLTVHNPAQLSILTPERDTCS